MTDWTSGYIADQDYPHGHYRELAPEMIRLVALARDIQAGPCLRYCELGCGQGFSANIIAAANPNMQVYATDFNPSMIAGARELAQAGGGANVHFFDHAFEDFADTPGLPDQFDIIALHGIYSWVSSENRAHIVAFIKRRLKVGGFVYVSYNTMPGWADALPLRRLMTDQANLASGPSAVRIAQAIGFVDRFQAVQPGYFVQNPEVAPRFENLKEMPRAYLAHELFNRDFTPFYFADLAAEMAEAKLTFAGSAYLLDHLDDLILTDDQQKLFADIPDPVQREGLRDYILNRRFRRDIFVKGALAHSGLSAQDALLDMRFALSTLRADIPQTVTGPRGEASLQPEVYDPILDAFAEGPITVRQLVSDPRIANLGRARLMHALVLLVGSGHLEPALPATHEGKRRERTRAFNLAVCERAKSSTERSTLASPVTGAGVTVSRFGMLFLLARAQKQTDPAAYVWSMLDMQGQRLVQDGKPIDTAEGNIAMLRMHLAQFDEKRLPVLRQLGIA